MEELMNKILGTIIIAGFMLGIIIPMYLIIRNDAGQATIPIEDIFKLTKLVTHKSMHLLKQETMDTSNWTSISLKIEVGSGTLIIETDPNTEDILVKTYSSTAPVSITSYEVSIEEPLQKIHVFIDDSNTMVKLIIPSNKIESIKGEVNGGVLRIELDGPQMKEIGLTITGGLAWINVANFGKSNTSIKVTGGAVYANLEYKYFEGESILNYQCSGGLLNSNIKIDSSTSIWLKTSTQGGYSHVTLNNEEIIDQYKDTDYDSSISKIKISITTTGGFTDIGIEK